jgi:hypothetical protein
MQNHFTVAKSLTQLLDNQFEIMGVRFGLDPILGVVPFLGDMISLCLSAYIIWIGHQMNIPGGELAKMWRNVVLDFIIGSVPFIGDVSDFFFKANTKNLAILEKYRGSETIINGEVV